jgi:pilus assembly protein TadC
MTSTVVAFCAALVVLGLGAAGRRHAVVARATHAPWMASASIAPRRSLQPLRRTPRRESRRRREHRLDHAFPDLLDLFVVTVQAGLLPLPALADLRSFTDPVLADGLDEVIARVDRGERFVDALDRLVDAWGPRALTFVATVGATERNGLPLAPALERLADEARQHRRHGAEAAARELPVRLSFPLVLCTLPAFVLVAIVPLLVGALSSLRST